MKTASLEINENIPLALVKYLTKAFSEKSIKFGDFDELLSQADKQNKSLLVYEKAGLVEQKLFERPFQWVMEIPDEPKLYDFYRFIKTIDNSLLRVFRAYHMRLIDENSLKKERLEVTLMASKAKVLLGGE